MTGSTLRRRSPSHRAFVAWLLIAGFLMQPVLAYLVTPVLTHDVKGKQVVVCTLKGQQIVQLDLPPISDAAQADGSEHCAAIKLYQMAGSTQVSSPPVVPAVALYSIEMLDQTADHTHRSLHFSAYSTRAPPAFS